MAPLRHVDPTGLYHVFSRGNYRQALFLDDEHYAKFLTLLPRVAHRRRWRLLDWCLMPNHFHLVIQLEDGGLSDGMRELNGCFSRWSNQQTGRTGTGHLVKNRFGSIDVIREGHLWSLLSYIPLNPVRAGLVDLPEEWPWGGYRATIGLEHPYAFHDPASLLRLFGRERSIALPRYMEHVRSAHVRDDQDTWSDQVA
jgi:REP element-mobilizing transposase RayT